jgi:hypothetical protein
VGGSASLRWYGGGKLEGKVHIRKASGWQFGGFFRWTHRVVGKGFYRVFEKSRVNARGVSALFDLVKFESFDLLLKSVYITLKRQFKNSLVVSG